MRPLAPLLLALSLAPALARGDEERPILVLDAGGHTANVRKVLFTPDGRELISVSDDKTIRVWDVASGEPLRVLRPPIGPGSQGKVFAAALSPDGRTLAVAGYGFADDYGRIVLITFATGRIERVLKGHASVVDCLAFDARGKRLASVSKDKTARIWDVASGRCEQVLQGHTNYIMGVAFSPDDSRLATASYDFTARLWSAETGQAEAVLRGHTKEVHCVAWSPDGQRIATGSLDLSIRIWGPDGSALKTFDGLGSEVTSLGFSTDSRSLLFCKGEGPGDLACPILDMVEGRERVRFAKHTNSVLSGTFSPDGILAATSGGDDNEIYLWKTADATTTHRLAGLGHSALAAAWSPDGKAIAWGNTNRGSSILANKPIERAFRPGNLEFAVEPDGAYRRAQPSRGSLTLEKTGPNSVAVKEGSRTTATLSMANAYDQVQSFTLIPGDRAVTGSGHGLLLFDARSGKRLREFQGHTSEVWAVAPSPDGRYILSASDDQTLRVWDLDRDEPLLSLFFAGDDWVAWTPEGYYAASPGGERLMGWHVGNGREQMASFYPASKFRKAFYRPDVIKQVLTTGSVERALEVADAARGRATEKVELAEVLPPTVEVTSPRPGKTLTAPRVEVKAVARSRGDRPVTALRLLLDGRPYQGQGGIKPVDDPKAGEARAAWQVDLEPGAHRLAVLADTDKSQGTSPEVEVTYEAEQAVELPSLYVLAVGISDYPGDLKLHYAAKDADAIERSFVDKSKNLFKKVEVKKLTDAGAKRKDILGGLTWLRKQMTQKDIGVVFFSGHGMRDGEGSLYLLPVDADPDDLLATAVADVQLKKALAGMPGRLIALLDACHAGALDGDRRKGPPNGLTDDLVRDLVTDDYGVVVMASSIGPEFSLENNAEQQSNFTLAIVQGLAGGADYNKDGVVYLNELDNYVAERVKVLSRGKQHPATARPASVRSFPLARP